MRRSAIGVFNGNWKHAWKRDAELTSDRRRFIIEQNQLNFGDALDELKAVDPQWEAWFDDDENIPPYIHWLDTHAINVLCQRMRAREEKVIDEKET
jgi:hypothetical protein